MLLAVREVGAAVNDEGMAGVEAGQGVRDSGHEIGGVDAEDLSLGAGGVGHRAEKVEGGADTEGTAEGHHGLHGGLEGGCGEEGEAMGAKSFGGVSWGEVDGDAESFEDVG